MVHGAPQVGKIVSPVLSARRAFPSAPEGLWEAARPSFSYSIVRLVE